MTKQEIAVALLERWNPLYAVLDSAQVPNVFERLQSMTKTDVGESSDVCRNQPLEVTSLFQGREAIELSEVAPILVEIGPHHRLLQKLVQEGWGKPLGIYFRSRASPSDVAAHLRQFIKVESDDGQLMFFRYYDPRVLRSYLPTCTATERREFFGDGPIIQEFISQAHDTSQLMVFRWDGTSELISFEESSIARN